MRRMTASSPVPISQPAVASRAHALWELAGVFLKLSVTGLGGPAAHIATMEAELVRRRHWLAHDEFMDLLGATYLIPGPNSTELAIHLGYLRGGGWGLVVAGVCFIVPAAVITGLLAWLYVVYGALPQVLPALHGMQAAVVAVVLQAVVQLGKSALKTRTQWGIAVVALVAALLGAPELVVVFGGGLVALPLGRARVAQGVASIGVGFVAGTASAIGAGLPARPSLLSLALFFAKVGSVLYGSGYVLVAFLLRGLVAERGWLSSQMILDAVAAGQVTPGPVFTTATFVGYLLRGPSGAAVATAAIFAPSFVLVALLTRVLSRLRRSTRMRAFLDGVNASSLSLMVAAAVALMPQLVGSPRRLVVLLVLTVLGIFSRGRFSPSWLVLLGGLAGLLFSL